MVPATEYVTSEYISDFITGDTLYDVICVLVGIYWVFFRRSFQSIPGYLVSQETISYSYQYIDWCRNSWYQMTDVPMDFLELSKDISKYFKQTLYV